jgi:hypothetical protein
MPAPLLDRDPITQRYICCVCWNQFHDLCYHVGCCCICNDSTEIPQRERKKRQPTMMEIYGTIDIT